MKRIILFSSLASLVVGIGGTYGLLHYKNLQIKTSFSSQIEGLEAKNQQLQLDVSDLRQLIENGKLENQSLLNKIEEKNKEILSLSKTKQIKTVEKSTSSQAKASSKAKNSSQKYAAVSHKSSASSQLPKQNKQDLFNELQRLTTKETTLKANIKDLNTIQAKLATKLQSLSKECQELKQGNSWDANSDACDKLKLGEQQAQKLSEKQLDTGEALHQTQKRIAQLKQ